MMNTTHRGVLALAALFATVPLPVHAQDVEAEAPEIDEATLEQARQHYQTGAEAYSNGQFRAAAVSFERSYELSHRPALLFNIAQCHDRLGRWAKANELYREYLNELPHPPNLEFVSSRLEFTQERMEREAENAESDAPRASEEDFPTPIVEPQQTETPEEPSSESSSTPIAGIVITALGGAALGTSLALGFVARSKYTDLEDKCPTGVCDASLEADADSMRTFALTADILLGVGLAAAVTGLVLILTGGGGDDDEDEDDSVAATCGLNGCMVSGRF